jgi:hypothetical protein
VGGIDSLEASMLTIAANLQRLSLDRRLDPVYADELQRCAQEGDSSAFIDAIPLIVAALKEHSERAKAA